MENRLELAKMWIKSNNDEIKMREMMIDDFKTKLKVFEMFKDGRIKFEMTQQHIDLNETIISILQQDNDYWKQQMIKTEKDFY